MTACEVRDGPVVPFQVLLQRRIGAISFTPDGTVLASGAMRALLRHIARGGVHGRFLVGTLPRRLYPRRKCCRRSTILERAE